MSPYALLALTIGVFSAFAGAGALGFNLGIDHERAGQMQRQDLVAEAVDAANNAAAAAIANIKIKNTTIQNEVQREVHEKLVYSDCRHSPDGLRLVNQALDPAAIHPGGSKLPSANPAP